MRRREGVARRKMTINIKGYEVLIDDDMADEILRYKWSVQSRRHGVYFAAKIKEPDGKKKAIFLHRFIMGDPKGKMGDHKFGNHFDNRRENLRVCENPENSRNAKIPKTNTSGVKGVTKRGKKWEANIRFDGRPIYLGRYETVEEAALVYEKKAKELFGEYYREAIGA
jgi:hypothetical protein